MIASLTSNQIVNSAKNFFNYPSITSLLNRQNLVIASLAIVFFSACVTLMIRNFVKPKKISSLNLSSHHLQNDTKNIERLNKPEPSFLESLFKEVQSNKDNLKPVLASFLLKCIQTPTWFIASDRKDKYGISDLA